MFQLLVHLLDMGAEAQVVIILQDVEEVAMDREQLLMVVQVV